MEKIQRWRDAISWFFAAITVALSYEIRNKGIIKIPATGKALVDDIIPVVLAISILLSSLYIARKFTKFIISLEFVRSLILGENHVEGFWYLQTDPHESQDTDNNSSQLSPDGILWLRYEPSWDQYATTTTRLDENDNEYQVPSKIINLRPEGQLLLYVNYFTIDNTGNHSTEGVSKGRFVKKGDESKTKDRIDAFIFTEGENSRHQCAEIISRKEIQKYKKLAVKSGNSWQKEFLLSRKGIRDNSA